MKYRNYEGELVEAPEDYELTLAASGDGHSVVWSYDAERRLHQVRYALGAKVFGTDTEAATEFGSSVRHKLASEGYY